MDPIPDRGYLESMSRTDIQRLCKVYNIKANMRTDEMINALCDLVSGKDVPRPHRSASDRVISQPPRTRLGSVQPLVSQPAPVSFLPSQSTTEMPASAPTTRRKAKELQIRLGKGRPVIAGGSGARNITKVSSRASGRRTKASIMLQEDPIPEQDEGRVMQTPIHQDEDFSALPDLPSSSVRPLSPLPTPAPSQPPYSLPSAALSALESRIVRLEAPNIDSRLSLLEAAMSEMADLKASVARIPMLQDEIQRLETAWLQLNADMEESREAHMELKNRMANVEVHAKGLVVENGALKERVAELEEKLRHRDDPQDTSMSSVIIHSPGRPTEVIKDTENAGTMIVAKVDKRTIPNDELPMPSPSQPTLGKRARSETPDASLTDIDAHKGKDAELEAIYRVIRPQRKKQRIDVDLQEETLPFQFFRDGPGGPSSTSTPQHRRSDPSSGFFTAGPAPTLPGTQGDVNLCVDKEESRVEAVAGPSNHPSTLLSNTAIHTAALATESSVSAVNVNDPAFFSGPPPVVFRQTSQLPFPLTPHARPAPLAPAASSVPSTPPNVPDAQDILERSTQFTTPVLGEPWRFEAAVTPSQRGDSTGDPATPSDQHEASSSTAGASGSSHTFRAGSHRERNVDYNPYFTPRPPGASPRTGITPTRGFSFSLRSPPAMETVPEVAEPRSEELDENGVRRSPPPLDTLFGTELEGDNRFGEYNNAMGRFSWRNLLPGSG